ncbi:3-oxo-5-alpha-steroid 4-dehydrogenase, C-terminal [Parasponia andersonii]|uniref:3-oxo-5-alpha-steroid 4-dehydrogenase, C-terminal n=1 Tax=Parasponia andersonii TaxID=3476 RepID=A0A2P5C0W7_PARAD|nr:3-oxo-5-alpha-steroid 4-dehydrogenase, C-terminal [Parasponia andersonii]
MESILTRFILPTPPSLYIKALSLVTVIALPLLGLLEMAGKHLGYSKFYNFGSQNRAKMPSRAGMLLLYTPAFLTGLATLLLVLPHNKDLRFFLVSLALTIHFFKRIFEVIFIHKYSGGVVIDSAILISFSYFSSAANMIYCHYKLYPTQGPNSEQYHEQPTFIDLKYIGVLLFLIGISGNFYHHYLLSQLRKKGDKDSYKIPKGGLFGLVICPHYLFEILGFVGISFISQTSYAFSFTLGTIFYLVGRSYATRNWYLSKFEDFPKEVKALIPFVF